MEQKILTQIVEMLGVVKFAAKTVFGKDVLDLYMPMNLGAIRIVQGKLNFSRVFHFDEGLFQSSKPDAVTGKVRNHTGVALPVLDEHPFKTDFLANDLPSFQHHAENMPAQTLIFQPDPVFVLDEFGHILGIKISA